MTCIVGIEIDGDVEYGVMMAADSFTSDHHVGIAARSPKVFRKNGVLFGISGSQLFDSLVRHKLRFPSIGKKALINYHQREADQYVAKIVMELRKLFLEHEMRLDSGADNGTDDEGEMLLGVGHRLYTVQGDFTFDSPRDGYFACGSGAAPALGALAVQVKDLPTTNAHARTILRTALRISSKYSPFVRGPYWFIRNS